MNQITPYAPLILLLIAAGVAAYLVIHYHITVATVMAKFQSLESKLGLIHAAAQVPVSVTLVPIEKPVVPAAAGPAPSVAAALGVGLTTPGGPGATTYNPDNYPDFTARFAAWQAAGKPEKDSQGRQLDVRGALIVGNDADLSKNPPYPDVWEITVAKGATATSTAFEMPAGTYMLWEGQGASWFSGYTLNGFGPVIPNRPFTLPAALSGATLSASCTGNPNNAPSEAATLQCAFRKTA